MLTRKRVALLSSLLIYAVIVPVFAYMYFYRTETTFAAGIVFRTYDTPTMKLGLYSDDECTQPITTVDYGNMTHPAQETIIWTHIVIRNEGSVWNDIYWNSTLASVNTQITEWWGWAIYLGGGNWGPNWGSAPINGTTIQPGQLVSAFYGIKIPAYAAVGTFNWTLTIWGENYY
jgi:hypothetical protein